MFTMEWIWEWNVGQGLELEATSYGEQLEKLGLTFLELIQREDLVQMFSDKKDVAEDIFLIIMKTNSSWSR